VVLTRNRTRLNSASGFTLIEVLVVVAIVGVLSTLAISQVLRARMASNSAAALGSLRAINTAQQGYAHQCRGFAVSLTELRVAGNFLSPDLSLTDSIIKSGYQFDMIPGIGNTALASPPPGCTNTGTNYYATAAPLSLLTTGSRSYATNLSGTIFFNTTQVPPDEATFLTTATPIQ
jgi:prepilin-type N-terminal cleavage/methylation domain-containing protein